MSMLKKLLIINLLLSPTFSITAMAEQSATETQAAEQKAHDLVLYDKQKDTLNMNVTDMSLKRLLATIAIQSHIEVLFDDGAEQSISMAFDDAPLQKALENLLRGSSYAFRYTRDNNDRALLIGVTVLPEGDTGDGNAQSLLHAPGETFMHEKNKRSQSIEQYERQEAYNQRWQARLKEMSDEVREKAEKHAADRMKALDEKNAAREKRAQEAKEKREAFKGERKAQRQQQFEQLSPEEQAVVLQRRENIKTMKLNGTLPYSFEPAPEPVVETGVQ